MFGKPKFPLAIDIGSFAVKLVQLQRKKRSKGLVLSRLGMASVAPGAVREGSVHEPEELMRAIDELLVAEKVKEKEVVVALSGTAALVKTILIPSEPGLPVAEAIEAEVSQILPFPVEEARLSHQRIGRVEKEGEVMDEYLLIAVKRKPLSDLLDLLRHLEYEPRIVDVNFLAMESAFDLSGMREDGETAALVNIGASETLVNIIRDDHTILTRVIAAGGDRVTDTLASSLDVGRSEAEAIKVGNATPPSPRSAAEAVRSEAEYMAKELGRTFQLVWQIAPDRPIDRVILSGGGAYLDGLPAFLATSLDLPVVILQPLRNVEIPKGDFDPGYVDSLGAIAAIGAGLAYRAVEEG